MRQNNRYQQSSHEAFVKITATYLAGAGSRRLLS